MGVECLLPQMKKGYTLDRVGTFYLATGHQRPLPYKLLLIRSCCPMIPSGYQTMKYNHHVVQRVISFYCMGTGDVSRGSSYRAPCPSPGGGYDIGESLTVDHSGCRVWRVPRYHDPCTLKTFFFFVDFIKQWAYCSHYNKMSFFLSNSQYFFSGIQNSLSRFSQSSQISV